jgi:hypothetical protein
MVSKKRISKPNIDLQLPQPDLSTEKESLQKGKGNYRKPEREKLQAERVNESQG